MVVTTRLTWSQEQSLRKLLGNASLSLLYKSGDHRDDSADLLAKCSLQGPMLTVIHLKTHVVGVFTLKSFPESHKVCSEKLNASFCFSFRKQNEIEISTVFFTSVPKFEGHKVFFLSNATVIEIFLDNNNIYMHPYLQQILGCDFGNIKPYLQCEIFRVEGIKNNSGFIRKIATVTEHRTKLLTDLRGYKPHAHLDSEVRVLLLGPVGSGKSSFCNSVKSLFQGRHVRQAMVGSEESSITEHYRIYSVKDGKNGKSLPFMLCDSMGLDGREEAGLNIHDVPYILKGHVQDKYRFNPLEKITSEDLSYVAAPLLKDRIHCVAYVLDINSIDSLSNNIIEKLKAIHKEVLNCGIAHVALLTKVSNYDEILESDFLNMAKHMTSQSQVIHVHSMLGIPISRILMVDNYASEQSLNPIKDVVILSALKQMLRAAKDSLDDLPPQEITTT